MKYNTISFYELKQNLNHFFVSLALRYVISQNAIFFYNNVNFWHKNPIRFDQP